MGVSNRLGSSFLLLLLTFTASRKLEAAAGAPIQNNNYRLDLTRTVITGSTRKIGMGGAFVGVAEGNAAIPDNPAAVSYRPRAFLRPWEFDMVLGTLVTSNDDVDNSGDSSLIYGDRMLVDAGLMAQYEKFGIGFVGRATVFDSDDLPEGKEAQFLSGSFAVGYTVLERQLAFGVSVNPVGARLKETDQRLGRTDFELDGTGWGAGVIWHPERGHWRFGGAYTSAVATDQELVVAGTTPVTVGNLIAPGGVLVSQSLSLGTAYEWNAFPLGLHKPAIATFDVRIFGESPADANGSSSFVTQSFKPVGQKTVVTLHTGLEVEAVPRLLRLRVGTYHEPSRYDGPAARQHITGGFEIRATKFNIWGERPLAISYAIDGADRYLVHSVSIWLYTFTVPVPESPKDPGDVESPGT